MTVQQNTAHIQTTHIGSLPRPHNLLDMLKAKYAGQSYDEGQLNSVLTQAVADCVRKQVKCGIGQDCGGGVVQCILTSTLRPA